MWVVHQPMYQPTPSQHVNPWYQPILNQQMPQVHMIPLQKYQSCVSCEAHVNELWNKMLTEEIFVVVGKASYFSKYKICN